MRYNIPYLNYPGQPKALQKEDTKKCSKIWNPHLFFRSQCGQTMRRSLFIRWILLHGNCKMIGVWKSKSAHNQALMNCLIQPRTPLHWTTSSMISSAYSEYCSSHQYIQLSTPQVTKCGNKWYKSVGYHKKLSCCGNIGVEKLHSFSHVYPISHNFISFPIHHSRPLKKLLQIWIASNFAFLKHDVQTLTGNHIPIMRLDGGVKSHPWSMGRHRFLLW